MEFFVSALGCVLVLQVKCACREYAEHEPVSKVYPEDLHMSGLYAHAWHVNGACWQAPTVAGELLLYIQCRTCTVHVNSLVTPTSDDVLHVHTDTRVSCIIPGTPVL